MILTIQPISWNWCASPPQSGSETYKKVKTPLKGNGDFRNAECLELLDESDIVVTNPPFSLWREYIAILIEHNKKFIILGNQKAITYKEVFPLVKEGKFWAGYNGFLGMDFEVPETYDKGKIKLDEKTGKRYTHLGNVAWYTNLDHDHRHRPIVLWKEYEENKQDYPKYDDFDAIDVSRVNDIPCDYFGVMGVPGSFFGQYCPEQFELVGEANHGSDNEYDLCKPMIDGKSKFPRLLVKRVQEDKHDSNE